MKLNKMSKNKTLIIVTFLLLLNSGNTISAQGWQKKTAPIMTPWSETIDTLNVLGEYPRPQFVRADWMNLNGVWDYKRSEGMGLYRPGQKFTQRILVPFPIESALSGIMDSTFEDHTKALLYRRYFTIPETMSGKNILLRFGAVDWQAEVYINGKLVGSHKGGYDPFYFDITSYLKASGPQEIQVQVFDPGSFGGQPHGKQQNRPGGIWYTTSSGIWQTVWLEPVTKTYIYDYKVTPDVDKSLVRVKVSAKGVLTNTQAVIRVYDAGNLIATQVATVGTEVSIPISNAKLWSPESPFLYHLEFDLNNGEVLMDHATSYFGMRKIGLGKINGTPCILLNDKPYFQFGLLDQGWWPDGLYTAPSDKAMLFDLIKTKELGMNMTRKHIKVEPDRWYYHCDTMGLLVWQDIPCAESGGTLGNITWQKNNFYREMKNIINSLENHPSIISWIPYNEAWGQDSYTDSHTIKGVDEALSADTTRLINPASGFTNFELGDIVDRHYYPNPGIWQNLPKHRAAVCGEYGGITLVEDGHIWKGSGIEYTSVSDGEELTTRFIEYANDVKSLQGNGLWAAVYTEITDVEEELNGLISYDRKIEKLNKSQIQRIKAVVKNSTTKMLIPIIPTALNEVACEWKYTLNTYSNWYKEGYDDASWSVGNAGFGQGNPPESSIRTPWSTPTIYLRKSFPVGNLSGEEINALKFIVYYDEGCSIYINGVLATNTTGFIAKYKTLEINAAAKAAVKMNGDNLIAVKCSQTGGGQYIDVGLMTEVPISSLVPDDLLHSALVDHPSKTGIFVFPNPMTNGEFFIHSDQSKMEKVEVFDLTGKIVKTFDSQPVYKMNGFPKSIYILKIKTDHEVYTSKILYN